MSLPREAREGGPGTAASPKTSGPTAPPLGEHESLETVPLLKKLLTSQSRRSASERPGSVWGSRAQEELHRPGSARPGGLRAPGLRSPHLQLAPSRTRRRGARSPPPGRPAARPPGQDTAYRARRRRRSSAGLHARVSGLTGWAGAGRGSRTGRTGRGCGPRSMPGNTSQGRAREAPPPPGSKRRAPPTSPTPPGPRAQPRAPRGAGPTAESGQTGLRSLSVCKKAWSLGSRQRTGLGQKLGVVRGALLVSLEDRMPSGEAQGQRNRSCPSQPQAIRTFHVFICV